VPDIPVGRWVKFSAFVRQSSGFDGVVRFWQDGVLITEQTNVRTGHVNTNFPQGIEQHWAVTNYSDGISPSPATIYVDDAVVSTAAQ
jgi:hypothetical protein